MSTQFDPKDPRTQAKFGIEEAPFGEARFAVKEVSGGVRGSARTVIAVVAIVALAFLGWRLFQLEQHHYVFAVAVMIFAIAGFAIYKADSHATTPKAGSDSAADARYDGSSSGEP